jgi:hypothetical protein
MSVSKEVWDEPCFEYPGLRKEIHWRNDTEVYINISVDYENEKGWSFKKKYKDYRAALDSLSEYLKAMRERKASLLVTTSLTPEMTDGSLRRFLEDLRNKRVFLPDGGKGYKYKD